MSEQAQKRGWYSLLNSRKWHYFNGETTSLCRRYAVFVLNPAELCDDNHDSPDNCKECKRRREQLAQKEQ